MFGDCAKTPTREPSTTSSYVCGNTSKTNPRTRVTCSQSAASVINSSQSPKTKSAINPCRSVGLCLKSPGSEISLCNLCVLCVSVVCFCSEFINHRDTEKSAVRTFRAKPICGLTRRDDQRRTHTEHV